MSNNRIKSLLTEIADDALEYNFKNIRYIHMDQLDADQKDVLQSVHEEFNSLVRQGTHKNKYDVDPATEKRLYNQTINSFVNHPDGTNFENNNKVAAAIEYLSLFKSKPDSKASTLSENPSPTIKKSK